MVIAVRARAAASTNRRRYLPRRDVREKRRAAGGAERSVRAWPRPPSAARLRLRRAGRR